MTTTRKTLNNAASARDDNAKRIAAVMREAKIVSVSVRYSGQNDDGQNWDISAIPKESMLTDQVLIISQKYESSNCSSVSVETPEALEHAFSLFAEAWISELHESYENGTGGHGIVTLSADGSASNDHKNHVAYL